MGKVAADVGKRTTQFAVRKPKTTALIAGAGAYKGYGIHKKKKKKNPTDQLVSNLIRNFEDPLKKKKKPDEGITTKKVAKFGGGAALGAGATSLGTGIGAGLGSLVAPGVGTIVGGAAGAATGGYFAKRAAQRVGGKTAATGADVGGLVGLLSGGGAKIASKSLGRLFGRGAAKTAASGAGSAVGGRVASAGVKGGLKRLATKEGAKTAGKAVGRVAADIGAYEGTTMGLEKTLGGKGRHKFYVKPLLKETPPQNPDRFSGVKKRKNPLSTLNEWSDEARERSAEARRRASRYAQPSYGSRKPPEEDLSSLTRVIAGGTAGAA